jgi:uncharacterized membrane protein
VTASLSGYALDFPHWLIALISERLFGWKSTCGCYLMVLALVYVQGFKFTTQVFACRNHFQIHQCPRILFTWQADIPPKGF